MHLKSLLAAGLIAPCLAMIPTTTSQAAPASASLPSAAALQQVTTADLNGTTCRSRRTAVMDRSIKAGPLWRRHNYFVASRVFYRSCIARHMADTVRPTAIRTTVTQTTDEDCHSHYGEVGYRKTLTRTMFRSPQGNITHAPLVAVKCVDAGGILAVTETRVLRDFRAFPVYAVNGRIQNHAVAVTWRVDWYRADDGNATDAVLMPL